AARTSVARLESPAWWQAARATPHAARSNRRRPTERVRSAGPVRAARPRRGGAARRGGPATDAGGSTAPSARTRPGGSRPASPTQVADPSPPRCGTWSLARRHITPPCWSGAGGEARRTAAPSGAGAEAEARRIDGYPTLVMRMWRSATSVPGMDSPRPAGLDPRSLGFTRQRPVAWLAPGILARTGLRTALTMTFGA